MSNAVIISLFLEKVLTLNKTNLNFCSALGCVGKTDQVGRQNINSMFCNSSEKTKDSLHTLIYIQKP